MGSKSLQDTQRWRKGQRCQVTDVEGLRFFWFRVGLWKQGALFHSGIRHVATQNLVPDTNLLQVTLIVQEEHRLVVNQLGKVANCENHVMLSEHLREEVS